MCIKSLSETGDMSKPDFCGIIKSVEVLGYDKNPVWTRDAEGLKINTVKVDSSFPVTFKITIE